MLCFCPENRLLLKSFANWVLNETFSNNYVLLKISKIFCKFSGTNHSSWTRQAVNRATWIEKWVTVTAEIEIDTFLRAGSRSLPLTEKLPPAAPILTLVTYVQFAGLGFLNIFIWSSLEGNIRNLSYTFVSMM